jgi:hypothetical protein
MSGRVAVALAPPLLRQTLLPAMRGSCHIATMKRGASRRRLASFLALALGLALAFSAVERSPAATGVALLQGAGVLDADPCERCGATGEMDVATCAQACVLGCQAVLPFAPPAVPAFPGQCDFLAEIAGQGLVAAPEPYPPKPLPRV